MRGYISGMDLSAALRGKGVYGSIAHIVWSRNKDGLSDTLPRSSQHTGQHSRAICLRVYLATYRTLTSLVPLALQQDVDIATVSVSP